MKQPALMFYVGDWKKDPALSLCSPATRGVWMDAIAAMHELRTGRLVGTPEELSRVLRCSPADVTAAARQLATTGTADVTERNGVLTIICRRLAREAKERESNRLRQSRFRGNPPPNGSVTPLSPPSSVAASSSPAISDANTHEPERAFSVPPEKPVPGELFHVVQSLQAKIAPIYGGARRWSHLEETLLLEIARGGFALAEVERILAYREHMAPADRARFFPQSALRLLEKWGELLDRAKTHADAPPANAPATGGPLTTAEIILRQNELKRVEDALERLRKNRPEGGDDLKAWVAKLSPLKTRRAELLKLLGMSA